MPNLYHNSVTFASQVMQAFDLVKTMTASSKHNITAPPVNLHCSGLQNVSGYQFIIHSLTGQYCTRLKAKKMWLKVLEHHKYMMKSLKRDPGIVVAALDYVENINQISQKNYVFIEQKELQQLVEMSLFDGLTQLYNRNTFMLLVDKELQLAKRHKLTGSLLMIDLDNFKAVNDNNGHKHGDDILLACANIIKMAIRSMDIAGRFGGDEFMAYLPNSKFEEALLIAERIKDTIRLELSKHKSHNTVTNILTTSIGISFYPQNGNDVNELIQAADSALYSAKGNGKNLVHC